MRTDIDRKSGTRFAAVFLFLAVALSAAASAAERQGPRIYIADSRFEFGTVDQGSVAEHVFEIKNLGDAVLEIGRIQPT